MRAIDVKNVDTGEVFHGGTSSTGTYVIPVLTALLLVPLAYAMALTAIVALTTTGPLYRMPVSSLGVEPSVV